MTQVKAEETTRYATGKKLTLRKETLRDLKARNPRTQQVNGGASKDSATGDQCTYRVSGCV